MKEDNEEEPVQEVIRNCTSILDAQDIKYPARHTYLKCTHFLRHKFYSS